MKLESEKCSLPSVSPEDISRLIDNAEERGSFLSLIDEKASAHFIQIEDCDEGFALEWRNGESAKLERSNQTLTPAEAKEVLSAFLLGDGVQVDGSRQNPERPRNPTLWNPKYTGYLLGFLVTILFLVLSLVWRFS